jgi:hypothetical protein
MHAGKRKMSYICRYVVCWHFFAVKQHTYVTSLGLNNVSGTSVEVKYIAAYAILRSFRPVCKIAKNNHYLRHIRIYVRPP